MKKASQVFILHFALKKRAIIEEIHEKQEQVQAFFSFPLIFSLLFLLLSLYFTVNFVLIYSVVIGHLSAHVTKILSY